MEKFDINWSEEIRKFLERRVEELEKERALSEVRRVVEKVPPMKRGTASKLVREDRESH